MIIFGAGSLGIQICDQLITNGIDKNEIVFYDNRANALELLPDDFKTISTEKELKQLIRQDSEIFIGIGHPHLRGKIASQMMNLGGKIGSVKSSSVQISNFCKIGQGYYIQPNVSIAHNVEIGDMAVIHANSIISHDVVIGNNISLSPNVSIMKNVQIGDSCFIGTNSIIMPNVSIGKRVIIAANIIVSEDLPDYCNYTSSVRNA
jgi:sugar O-acyltransferase (sialic acid O-acetyltransferase NeuD family)